MLLEPSQSPQPVRDAGQLLLWWVQSGINARRHAAALGLALATSTSAPNDVPFISYLSPCSLSKTPHKPLIRAGSPC